MGLTAELVQFGLAITFDFELHSPMYWDGDRSIDMDTDLGVCGVLTGMYQLSDTSSACPGGLQCPSSYTEKVQAHAISSPSPSLYLVGPSLGIPGISTHLVSFQ